MQAQEVRAAPQEASKETRQNPCSISRAHVLFQRVMIRTGAAFETFKDWLLRAAKLSGATVPGGSTGPRVSWQLTAVIVYKEREVTTKLLLASSICGLSKDARQDNVPVLFRGVLWSWPRGLSKTPALAPGVTSPSEDGGAPWIAERFQPLFDPIRCGRRLERSQPVGSYHIYIYIYMYTHMVSLYWAEDFVAIELCICPKMWYGMNLP